MGPNCIRWIMVMVMVSVHQVVITVSRNLQEPLDALSPSLRPSPRPSPSGNSIGVCYGMLGDNLPSPKEVVSLFERNGFSYVRLFDPNKDALEALKGSNLLVNLGVVNNDLVNLSANQDAAKAWVDAHVVPYKNDIHIRWIGAGNEVIPGPLAVYVAPAMNNIYNALVAAGLGNIKVSTVVPGPVLSTSYPPSAGAFSAKVSKVMNSVLSFLSRTKAPLMVNVYPYFGYASNPKDISLEYASFMSKVPVVKDRNLSYYNMFDATVDAFYAAMEKAGARNVPIIVTETGWPSAGREPYTSISNARTYNANLIKHVNSPHSKGTPRRPGIHLDTFIFAMFNENLKPAGEEQHFGLFNPNMEPVYPFL